MANTFLGLDTPNIAAAGDRHRTAMLRQLVSCGATIITESCCCSMR